MITGIKIVSSFLAWKSVRLWSDTTPTQACQHSLTSHPQQTTASVYVLAYMAFLYSYVYYAAYY